VLVRLAAIGLAAGLFGAILGVGGGIVVVPLLVFLFAYDQRRAAATSMGAIAITATVGAIAYAIQGHQHPTEAALLGVPAGFGVVAGTAIQQRLPLRALQLVFGGFLVVVAIRLLAPEALPFHAADHRAWWVYAACLGIGLLGGVLAGLFGVGGGILFVPTFVLLLGLPQLDAGATSLLAMLPASFIGAWRQSRYGNLDWRASVAIGLASIGGVGGGIAIAERLPEATLRSIFGAFLLLTAGQIAWRARRR
jgi:uncharacterized membrane protein YfcA